MKKFFLVVALALVFSGQVASANVFEAGVSVGMSKDAQFGQAMLDARPLALGQRRQHLLGGFVAGIVGAGEDGLYEYNSFQLEIGLSWKYIYSSGTNTFRLGCYAQSLDGRISMYAHEQKDQGLGVSNGLDYSARRIKGEKWLPKQALFVRAMFPMSSSNEATWDRQAVPAQAGKTNFYAAYGSVAVVDLQAGSARLTPNVVVGAEIYRGDIDADYQQAGVSFVYGRGGLDFVEASFARRGEGWQTGIFLNLTDIVSAMSVKK